VRRGLVALGLVLAALALGACGGEGSDEAADGAPDHVAEEFLNAIYEADGATACRLSSTEAQVHFANGDDCVANIINIFGPTAADREEFANASFDVVKQSDGKATVEGTLANGSPQSFELVLQDGQWKIDAG
jgi:hypothetical protein